MPDIPGLDEGGDFGGKGPRKLRKPFQQVQHNCNNYSVTLFVIGVIRCKCWWVGGVSNPGPPD